MEQQLQWCLGQTAGSVCSVSHQAADGYWTEQSCCQLQAELLWDGHWCELCGFSASSEHGMHNSGSIREDMSGQNNSEKKPARMFL